jgi:hypothetical protein
MVETLDREFQNVFEDLSLLVYDAALPGNSRCSEVTTFPSNIRKLLVPQHYIPEDLNCQHSSKFPTPLHFTIAMSCSWDRISTLKALHSSNHQETLIQWQNKTSHRAWLLNNTAVETSNLTFQNIISATLHSVPQWSGCSFTENSNLLFTCWVIATVIQVDWHNIFITLCSLYNHKYTLLMQFESEASVACTVTNICSLYSHQYPRLMHFNSLAYSLNWKTAK